MNVHDLCHDIVDEKHTAGSVEPSLHSYEGVLGVDWRFYKHPLPENVYDVYMQQWTDVELLE